MSIAGGWERDLHEEGIEPHPGPRYISKNINSLKQSGALFKTLRAIRIESTRTPITAVFIQDHRLPRSYHATAARMARNFNILLVAAYAPPHTNGTCYGGTMILIPHTAIELEKGEDIHSACDRIRASRKASASARILRVTMKVGGHKRALTAAYAPSVASDRPPFFASLATRLTKQTVLAIDANCVPDPAKDLRRTAASPYPNIGAKELHEAVDTKQLRDIVRELSDPLTNFTPHHIGAGGHVCWSRIDQIYVPTDQHSQYTIGPPGDLSSRYAGSCSIVSCLYVLNMGIHMFGYKSSPCDSTMSSRIDIGCGHLSTPPALTYLYIP